ncbi:MAG TPA: hypothetical protein VN853_03590 [Polyangia bacterium]|jgi:hypothetical protein|nr:hypothetical protein [Polyangia bacterium]
MDQPRGTSDAKASALSASWAAWEAYYREASRRRRAMGASRSTLREEKRRRRIRERVGLAVSSALVGGLTLVFYFVLTHR